MMFRPAEKALLALTARHCYLQTSKTGLVFKLQSQSVDNTQRSVKITK